MTKPLIDYSIQRVPEAESIKLFIEDQALSLSYDLASSPASPTPVNKLSLFPSLPVCYRARVWEEPVHTTARKPGVLYKSFNTLWMQVSVYGRLFSLMASLVTLSLARRRWTRMATGMSSSRQVHPRPDHTA